ncbi:MAG TPA: hypothetical protein QGH56_08425, partial [Candidatus Marinimicrobia bacterium]|nr:hypothetical protein [Candidatus Neomarinimicrobiota bacterium]
EESDVVKALDESTSNNDSENEPSAVESDESQTVEEDETDDEEVEESDGASTEAKEKKAKKK